MNKTDNKIVSVTIASQTEQEKREEFFDYYSASPIPKNEQLSNLGLFIKRQDLSKMLFLNEIYQKIVDINGIIIEFGTRWGQNLVTLSNLRGIYEPYNLNRKIIGFDTFEGFKNIRSQDGKSSIIKEGNLNVSENYEEYLEKIMQYHASESPLSHIKRFEIRKGDASDQLKSYLEEHPETIIAFAYFDFDIYQPTKECLNLILPYLTKGSILGFDELTDSKFPGETIALREMININNYKIKRNKFCGIQSYLIFE